MPDGHGLIAAAARVEAALSGWLDRQEFGGAAAPRWP
jgi:hypothetical protein